MSDTTTQSATTTNVISMNDLFFNKLAKIIPDGEERMALIPAKLNNNLKGIMVLENALYHHADQMAEDNHASVWHSAEINDADKNTFFMFPDTDKPFAISNPTTQSRSLVDARTFGLINTILVFNRLCWHYSETDTVLSQIFVDQYHNLKDAYYQLVDDLAYNEDGESEATPEQIEEIKAMSKAVWSQLD